MASPDVPLLTERRKGTAQAEALISPAGGEAHSREVTLHIFIRGAGPKHVLRQQLMGWDQDRLPLRDLLQRFNLKALYALSSSGTRGLHLVPDPRNGLSVSTYSARGLDPTIRLDGEPKVGVLSRLSRLSGAFLLTLALAMGLLVARGHFPSQPLQSWLGAHSEKETPLLLWALGFLFFIGIFWRRLTGWYK